ncbi:hypothetical protein FPSE5266_20150 [Fusarium pseudograminearum]|nr:hypothetical protein FPSE5266_20150 [Fusarium pseudograminearum]
MLMERRTSSTNPPWPVLPITFSHSCSLPPNFTKPYLPYLYPSTSTFPGFDGPFFPLPSHTRFNTNIDLRIPSRPSILSFPSASSASSQAFSSLKVIHLTRARLSFSTCSRVSSL